MVKVKETVAFFEKLSQTTTITKFKFTKKKKPKNEDEAPPEAVQKCIEEITPNLENLEEPEINNCNDDQPESGYFPEDYDEESNSDHSIIATKLEEIKQKFRTVSKKLDNKKVLDKINELHEILDSILEKHDEHSFDREEEILDNPVDVKHITINFEKVIESNFSSKDQNAEPEAEEFETSNDEQTISTENGDVEEIATEKENTPEEETNTIENSFEEDENTKKETTENLRQDSTCFKKEMEVEELNHSKEPIYENLEAVRANADCMVPIYENLEVVRANVDFPTNNLFHNNNCSNLNTDKESAYENISIIRQIQQMNRQSKSESMEETTVKKEEISEEPIYENIEELRTQLKSIKCMSNTNLNKKPSKEKSVEAINETCIRLFSLKNNESPYKPVPKKRSNKIKQASKSLAMLDVKLKRLECFMLNKQNSNSAETLNDTAICKFNSINPGYVNSNPEEINNNRSSLSDENFADEEDSFGDEYSEDSVNEKTSVLDSEGNFRMKRLSGENGTENSELRIPQKVVLLIDELRSSEKNFLKGLHIVVEEYMPYVENRVKEKLLKLVPCIFGNICDIFKQSKMFLKKLESSEYDLEKIAEIFIESESYLDLYKDYSLNKPKSDGYIKNLMPYMEEKQHLLGDMSNILSYLITPVQRMGKYLLLLENILKQLQMHNVEPKVIEKFENALQIVRTTMEKSNYSLTINSIKSSPIVLSECGLLLLHGRCDICINAKKSTEYMVFLFEKVIIFTKIVDPSTVPGNIELYFYESSINLTDLSINEHKKNSSFKLWDFNKVGSMNKKNTYIINAIQPKNSVWIKQIRDLLWLQLKNKKEEQVLKTSKH